MWEWRVLLIITLEKNCGNSLFCASFTITELQGDCNSSFPTRNLKFACVYAVDNR